MGKHLSVEIYVLCRAVSFLILNLGEQLYNLNLKSEYIKPSDSARDKLKNNSNYSPVIQHRYWTLPFIVYSPIENGIPYK